jgi:hypothetical protein
MAGQLDYIQSNTEKEPNAKFISSLPDREDKETNYVFITIKGE